MFSIGVVVMAIFQAVGFFELVKNFIPEKAPAWVKPVIGPVLAIAFSLINYFIGNSFPIVSIILTVVAGVQLFYETIVKVFKQLGDYISTKTKEIIEKIKSKV